MSTVSFANEINEIPRSFTKISFDTAKIKKPDKVLSTYCVRAGEQICAYIKSSVPLFALTVDGTIITDRALYIHPSHDDWAACNRFPFDELCKYFVYMEDEKSNVYLATAHNRYIIRGCTLFGRNTAGMELMQFIRALQSCLLYRYPWAQGQQNSAVTELLSAARTSMQTGRVPKELSILLDTVKPTSPHYRAVQLLKAEDVYRSCHAEAYRAFVERMPAEIRAALMEKQPGFEQALRTDLSNIHLNFDKGFLADAFQNLSGQSSRSEVETLLFAYICVRPDRRSELNQLFSQIKNKDNVQALEAFRACYYNTRMLAVYRAIEAGQSLSPEWLDWTDSMGLTPLHYAILLRKGELIADLLEKRTWEDACPLTEESAVCDAYSYTVLACLVGLPGQADLIIKTSKTISAQLRSQRAIEKQLLIQQKKLDLQYNTKATLQKAIRSASHAADRSNSEQAEKIENAQIKLENLNEAIQNTLDRIADLEDSLAEIKSEIEAQIEAALTDASRTADRLRDSSDPFVRYLYRLFTEPGTLPRILSRSVEGCRLYAYAGIVFAAPAEMGLDLPYRIAYLNRGSTYQRTENHSEQADEKRRKAAEQHTQQAKSNEPIQRPYGKHWFSPQAHSDMKALTKEYHRLAKQYHPDVCDHSRSQELFQEILNERAEILEQMAR